MGHTHAPVTILCVGHDTNLAFARQDKRNLSVANVKTQLIRHVFERQLIFAFWEDLSRHGRF